MVLSRSAMMGSALASGPDRARIAAEQAVACPLLEGIDLSGAKGVLVLITAAKSSLKLSESKLAMNTIRAYASPDAHVIYGTAYDDSLGDEIRVTVIATGLTRNSDAVEAKRQPSAVQHAAVQASQAAQAVLEEDDVPAISKRQHAESPVAAPSATPRSSPMSIQDYLKNQQRK